MINVLKWNALSYFMIIVGIGLSQGAQAAGYNPVIQQAQSKLATLGLDPGPLDGIAGGATKTAVQAFQKQSGLPETGVLDPPTLEKLQIGTSLDKAVVDWIPPPTQDELDKLIANPINDPGSPYTDYRPNAPAVNLDLPGASILAGRNLARSSSRPQKTYKGR